jgi:hypothetical protein
MPVGNLVCPQLTELELLSYMNDGNEAERWIRWSRWENWKVMCATDKSVDGTVGQVQNCDLSQTSSVIKCGISFADVSHGVNVNSE